jgi:hypothetical protein
VEFITTQRGVKHFSRVREKNFKKFFAVTQPNQRTHKMLCVSAQISPLATTGAGVRIDLVNAS